MLRFFGKKKSSRSQKVRARPRIRIITQYATRKGHTTLSKSIEFALDNKPEVFSIRKLSRLNDEVLYVKSHPVDACLHHERVIESGTQLRSWLMNQDIIIIIERAAPKLFDLCREYGIRSVVVPMIDWLPDDPAQRKENLCRADMVVVLTKQAHEILLSDGLENLKYIPASLHWPIPDERPARTSRNFYFNIGVGGPLNRRNVPMVLDIFNELLPKYPDARLVMKMVPRARKYIPELGPLHENIELIERSMSGDEMLELQRNADVSLFPTRFEGLGFPLMESLHSGVPVIATGAQPMSEFITHERNGLLIKATEAGEFGGQTLWDLDRDSFAENVERLMAPEGQDLLESLTRKTTEGIRETQRAWKEIWQGHFAELSPFVVNIGAGQNPTPGACNLDLRALDGIAVQANVRHLPFGDEVVDELIAEDLIEHFPKSETEEVLKEWVRVIKPGGKIRIQTPDLRALCKAFQKGKLSLDEMTAWLYGHQDYAENFHFTSFDERRLRALLGELGIENITRVTDFVSSKNLCLEGRRRRNGHP